ncbi:MULTISPECIES: DUF6988 family protein [Acinetobacter]|nr:MULTISPECIES: hypothetical protein [Acinetobacter]EXR34052.1 hypothetical protein J689_0919 [Acinetobacter sp. 1179249]MBJ8464740.1 hypothetical protein [Acinetobacter nosocomialis]MBP1489090.1 hypothetical protein [Acinetobacter nosocomialis]MBP1496270.1 hypothetical protein [Acinetobacter nosocomialis]MBR7716193.1 hypothetical protein [Acinetobacter nosocomialis]
MERGILLEKSLKMILELKDEIINSEVIDCGLRLDLVEQCIYISFEHGIGVNTLLTLDMPIQAMVLSRAQFESTVRAYWLLFCASNLQISKLSFDYTFEEQFVKDRFPTLNEMLGILDKANLPARTVINMLVEFKKYHLNQLNSFVHTGKHSFTRDEIGFDENLVLTLMRQSNNLITASAQIMLAHTIPDKQKFIHLLTEKYRDCFFLQEDLDPKVKARLDNYFS